MKRYDAQGKQLDGFFTDWKNHGIKQAIWNFIEVRWPALHGHTPPLEKGTEVFCYRCWHLPCQCKK